MHSTMMENGLDYILDAATKLKHSEETTDFNEKRHDIKYSLLHLLSGIELIMKTRLYIENWAYIFSKIDDADKEKIETGNFNSIEYSRCVERLSHLCNVNLEKDDKEAFDNLKIVRNRVEHYFINEDIIALEAKINKALTAIIKFINDNYDEFEFPSTMDAREHESKGLTEEEKLYIDKITAIVAELKSHHNEALKLALKRADSVCLREEMMICPKCGEQTLVINEKKDYGCHCYYCNYTGDGCKTLEKFLVNVLRLNEYSVVKDGGIVPIYACPECGRHSFIEVDNRYVCFSCGMIYDKQEICFCRECGDLYVCFDDQLNEGLCESCQECMSKKLRKE